MNKGIVITFGRFNPPTKGHARLIEKVQDEASRLGADSCIFASPTQDVKRNPLPFKEKVRFLGQMFRKTTFSMNAHIKNPFDALFVLSKMGYTRVTIVCGSDRTEEFQRIAKWIRKPKHDKRYIELQPNPDKEKSEFIEVVSTRKAKSDETHIVLQDYAVLPLPREDMSTLSATIMRSAAEQGDFKTFRDGLPTRNEGIARQLFTSVRRHMGIKNFKQFVKEAEAPKPKQATDVDRLKNQQKSEIILTKQRQSNDMFQAKRRELDQKSREQMNKITQPKTPQQK